MKVLTGGVVWVELNWDDEVDGRGWCWELEVLVDVSDGINTECM